MKRLIIFPLMASTTILLAQTKVELNPISVTTSRVAQTSNETGRSISVIEGKTLQQLPVNSLDELLKYVPGVEVQNRGPMGAQGDIVIRGGTYQQVLILLDGVKINDPLTGHFNGYMPIAPYEIERIEILRGPAAATYGAEAVGGVVHIITKTFSEYQDSSTRQGIAKLTGGEYNFFAADGGLRLTGKLANLSLGILSNNTTGQLLRGNNRGFMNNHSISGSIAFNLPRSWKLNLRSSYDNRDFAAQNFYTTFVSDTATEKVVTSWNQLQLKQEKSNKSQQFDAVYKSTSDEYTYNKASIPNQNKSQFALVQYISNYRFSKKINTTLGGQISQRSIQSNDRGNHNTLQSGLFGTILYTEKNWRGNGSIRMDYDENYGFALLPQINIAYILNNITFRGSIGRATRSADFTERYNNYNKTKLTGGSVGNPDLDAEKSWSYELGATVDLNDFVKLNTSVFLRSQNDVIDWTTTPYAEMPRQSNLDPGGVYALAKNIKKVETKGFEFELNIQKRLSSLHHLYANIGATILNSSSNDPNPSYYIIAHAKMMLQGTLIYQFKNASLSLNMLYKERTILTKPDINAEVSSSYLLVNLRSAYQINKHLSAFISCNNIGDIYYSDLLGSKMPNRWWTTGASFIL